MLFRSSCSEQTEALGELIQFLRGSTLKESSILQHSGRLLEHFHRLQTNALLSEEDQRPLASETRAFQTLAENTEAWVTALQQQADSVVTDGSGSQDQAEQRVLAIQVWESFLGIGPFCRDGFRDPVRAEAVRSLHNVCYKVDCKYISSSFL